MPPKSHDDGGFSAAVAACSARNAWDANEAPSAGGTDAAALDDTGAAIAIGRARAPPLCEAPPAAHCDCDGDIVGKLAPDELALAAEALCRCARSIE